MVPRVKLQIAFLLIVHTIGRSDAIGNLTSVPATINGTVTACQGDYIAITCVHDNSGSLITRWEVTGVPDCFVPHDPPREGDTCGPFTFSGVSNASNPILSSIAMATASAAVNGLRVTCRAGAGMSSPLVGSLNITVLEIPTPTNLTVYQVSQSSVRVNVSVPDSQCTCVDSYLVEAIPVGGNGSTNTSSSTSTVDVSGLDVCGYNYLFVGSAVTAKGVQGNQSYPVPFTANLTGLNGVNVTINQVDPLIEWVQLDNPLYPTCISGYEITDQATGLQTVVNSGKRSLTARQLNETGFPYCTTLRPTVTPVTQMGQRLTTVPGFNALYTILFDPDFPDPILTPYFALRNSNLTLQITIQSVAESIVPRRVYQYQLTRASPVFPFTGNSFVIQLPGATTGQNVKVGVRFDRSDCRRQTVADYTVPSFMITGLTQGTPTDTSQTITITLPLTEYQPEQLLIISTVEPPSDDGPIKANFTSPSMQYTVTFTDLDPATEYTFTIRIVLHSDKNVDVVPPANATFTTTGVSKLVAQSGGCGGGCIAGIVVGVVLFLLLVVIVIVVIVIIVKWRLYSANWVNANLQVKEEKLGVGDENQSEAKHHHQPQPATEPVKTQGSEDE